MNERVIDSSLNDSFGIDDQLKHSNIESLYLDRTVPSEDTAQRVEKYFLEFGITRIANQTDLDRIGIPCFAAFRPNSKTLANNQGKGLTAAAARASAIMESIEFAVAENPVVAFENRSKKDLISAGYHVVDIQSLLPIGSNIDNGKKSKWVAGFNCFSGEKSLVPLDAVSLCISENTFENICKGTNGLASGNTQAEAIFHGLCELIERDATTLWSLKDKKHQFLTKIDPSTWSDSKVIALLDQINQAKFNIGLFDQTSDIGIPSVMAVIGDQAHLAPNHFSLAAGYGAHPNSSRAAIRAITEAAQTRVTSIAGSRDDIDPSQYNEAAAKEHVELLEFPANKGRTMTSGLPLGMQLTELIKATKTSLRTAHYTGDVFVFPLSASNNDFSVVKIIAPSLEDRDGNTNWRPKERALMAILEA